MRKKVCYWRVNIFPKDDCFKDDYFTFVMFRDFDSVITWIHSKLFLLGITKARVFFIDEDNEYMKTYDYYLNNLDPDKANCLDKDDFVFQRV